MTGSETVIPPPYDDDDDDVAWALHTAQVQWRRGAKADAIVWLRRAVESAMEVAQPQRAVEINVLISELEELMVADVFGGSSPPPADGAAVDELLGAPSGRASIDIEFDDNERTEIVRSSALLPSEPAPAFAPAVTEPAGAMPALTAPALQSHRAQRPPPPSSMPAAPSAPPPPHLPAAPGAAPPHIARAVFEAATLVPQPDDYGKTLPPTGLPSFGPESGPAIDTEEEPIVGDLPSFPLPAELETRQPEPVTTEPAAAVASPATLEAAALTAAPEANEGEPRIGKVSLAEVEGLQDLPPEAHAELVRRARVETLDVDEEVSAFAVALLIEGWASIMPAIADVACAFAQPGDVVFTHGTLEDAVSLRVVAGETDTRVAVWDKDALDAATSDCPWVADELRIVADRFQALAGAAMGPLGDRLDDSLRQSVTERCEVRTFGASETIHDCGNPVPGMFIVGGGGVQLVDDAGTVKQELGPGEFLFATEMMGGSPAPYTARAAENGALLLFAERHTAHELMVSVPPLLEILAN